MISLFEKLYQAVLRERKRVDADLLGNTRRSSCHWAKITPTGVFTVAGVDYDNGSKPLVVVTGKAGRGVFVVRHPGGKVWAGNFSPREYLPSHLMVFQVRGHDPDSEFPWLVEEIISAPVRGVDEHDCRRFLEAATAYKGGDAG